MYFNSTSESCNANSNSVAGLPTNSGIELENIFFLLAYNPYGWMDGWIIGSCMDGWMDLLNLKTHLITGAFYSLKRLQNLYSTSI